MYIKNNEDIVDLIALLESIEDVRHSFKNANSEVLRSDAHVRLVTLYSQINTGAMKECLHALLDFIALNKRK